MTLSTFILANIEPILQEWENYAETIFSETQPQNKKMLRDHAKNMLKGIATDIELTQSKSERVEKSMGSAQSEITAADEHGIARMEEGLNIREMISEFRALRASVTKLWGESVKKINASDVYDLIRFNEAIDQAISESISSYSKVKEQQTRLFEAMLSSSPDLSYIMDLDGKFLYINQAMTQLIQKTIPGILGKFFYDFGVSSQEELHAQIQSIIKTGLPCRGEMTFKTPSNKDIFYEYIFSPVLDEHGKLDAIAGISRDITDRKVADDKIWKSANYDLLTGIPNRRLFNDRLKEAIKDVGREKEFALLYIDLDGFKKINDSFGHEVGDLLLKQTAERINASVRETDIIARMGGDEFTIILKDINIEKVKQVAEKILAELKRPFEIDQHIINISGSIGITLCQSKVDAALLIGNADRAMYAAKEAGRNRWSLATSDRAS